MICSVFRPSRRQGNKSVKRRLYWGQYRLDADRAITRVPLDTPDKQVARERLNRLVRTVQQEREGLVAPGPMRDAGSMTLVELGDTYTANLEALGRDDHYVQLIGERIRRLSRECEWKHLRDVTAASFQKWRTQQVLSAKTVNDYLATMRSLIRWLMKKSMAPFDPLQHVERVDGRGKPRRPRRAFTVDEVGRLLQVAPVDRRRFYLAGYYTGLRRSELEELQWGDIHLDEEKPYILARAATTKNRQDARLSIRPELLDTLRAMRPEHARENGLVFGMVLDVEGGHKLRRFRHDLKAAGIAYKDDQGRVADFHALSRVTPNTHMGQQGVGERVRQEFMRHSDLRLTSAVYTDVDQLPIRQAIMSLPHFVADGAQRCAQRGAQNADATGHDTTCPTVPDWAI